MSVDNSHDGAGVAERWDRVFEALSEEPRRQLILSLMDKSAAAWVPLPDAALSRHFQGSRDELRISLHHRHLPQLGEHDYVVWEDSPMEARQGPNFEEVDVALRAILANTDNLPDQMVVGCRALENQFE